MPDDGPSHPRTSPDPVPEPIADTSPAATRRGIIRRAVAGVAIDLSPMRESRDFRLLLAGQGVSFAGSMITYVAVPYQAYVLTRSSLVVGLVSLAELLPILLMAFVGGALADAVDRRRMVRITEVGLCAVVSVLVVNAALPHPQLWVLFVAVALAAGIDAVQRPSLDALVPRIVRPEQLSAAAALESLRGNLGQVLGPPLAGVLIATVGLPGTYGVDVATFLVSLIALRLMGAVPPPPSEVGRLDVRSVLAGVGYAWRRQDLLGSYLVDMNAMFFGMPMALFPQIAATFGGPAVLGVLYTAPSVGSLLASLTSGWTRAVRHHGRAIAMAAAAWGVAIVGFGLAPTLWLALLALAAAGAADMISGLFRTTLWNQTIPDAMRGRLAGIEMISYSSGPALGNLEAGLVGALAGVRVSVVSGGILCVLGTALLSAVLPRFRNYRAT
ncbi:MAG: MFS transporter [Candidatus Dormibacteraeota bacterium]|uniref:MFS transporter n=1 Tax=Candidatus Amunia macphersoniae TaxID=3127014 RepID=A0A934KIN2_9BACT|nr:MFS transporter [Candidatus Dormibacteraeota bacterium]